MKMRRVAATVATVGILVTGIAIDLSGIAATAMAPEKTLPGPPGTGGTSASQTPVSGSSSTAATPTPTSTTSVALAQPVAPLATFTGAGAQTLELNLPDAAAYIADIDFVADDDFLSSITITSVSADFSDDRQDVWWFSGSDSGRALIGAYTEDMRYLQVEADGSWTIELYSLDAATNWPGGEAHGVGSDVLLYTGEPGIVNFACTGDRYLRVESVTDHSNTVVSEECPAEGTAILQDAPSLIIVEGEGGVEWWLRI